MHDRYWDPFLRACEETETVVCLHNGSSSWTAARSPGAPLELYTSLFPVNALVTAADWLWAQVPDAVPRHQDRVLRGRHQLGADADRPHRLRARSLRRRLARLGRSRTSRRSTRCAATSGSARSTSARRSRCATTSASITSASRATIRTPTPRGPTRRRCAHAGADATSTPTPCARSRGRTRRSCSATRSRPNCRRR